VKGKGEDRTTATEITQMLKMSTRREGVKRPPWESHSVM